MSEFDCSNNATYIPGGGVTPTGTIEITENGTYNVAQYANADVNVSGGGGTSNIVTGTFTLTESGNNAIQIPYTGDGYIVALIVNVKGLRSNSEWSDLVANKAMETWSCIKIKPNEEPTINHDLNASRFCVYKNSSSSANSFTASANQSYAVYSTSPSQAYENSVVTIPMGSTSTEINVYGRNTSYGFALGIEYEYTAIYSE